MAGAASARQDHRSPSSLGFASAWVEETSSNVSMASAHLNIVNLGTEPDELVAAFSLDCASVLLHAPRAVPVADPNQLVATRIHVPPHGSLTVGSRGVKLLLIDPITPLSPGTRLTLTLRFRNAGDIMVELPVLAVEQRAQIARD